MTRKVATRKSPNKDTLSASVFVSDYRSRGQKGFGAGDLLCTICENRGVYKCVNMIGLELKVQRRPFL